MKAVVLAGGYATRLRPISYVLPKLLFPILRKPMIYWTLDLLDSVGVTEVILGVNYLADVLRAKVGSTYRGMQINYSLEGLELGTAGPIKLASIGRQLDETFIAMNGDVIAQIDLREMLKHHRQSKALITDALHKVTDPSRFGVVKMDAQKRIELFVEKPKRNAAPSHLVNAGIYLIEPEVLRLIPENRKVSLEREIFPALAKEGKLVGFEFGGYWFDIGNLTDFRKANFSLLRHSSRNPEPQAPSVKIATGAAIRKPVLFGDNSIVESQARVGPNTLLGNSTTIGKNTEVTQSILFEKVTIGEGSQVRGAIISTGVRVGKGVKIGRGAVISPNVTIADRTKIAAGAIIHPHKEISQNVGRNAHVM